jgi:hypothetical protein
MAAHSGSPRYCGIQPLRPFIRPAEAGLGCIGLLSRR